MTASRHTIGLRLRRRDSCIPGHPAGAAAPVDRTARTRRASGRAAMARRGADPACAVPCGQILRLRARFDPPFEGQSRVFAVSARGGTFSLRASVSAPSGSCRFPAVDRARVGGAVSLD